jgi:DNA-directed RNA polymerase I, II, and III subunit RPABC2
MDYRDEEPVADEEAEEEFEQVDADVAEAAEEVTEAQKAEAADLAKLLRSHPEIWIPYEEQVLQQLNPKAPGTSEETPAAAATAAAATNLTLSLRDLKSLDAKHVTYPFLSDYERTKCISFRASQICNGAAPYILVPEGVTDAYEIAKMELEAKRLPYILKRPMPDGSFEVWRLSDLVVF